MDFKKILIKFNNLSWTKTICNGNVFNVLTTSKQYKTESKYIIFSRVILKNDGILDVLDQADFFFLLRSQAVSAHSAAVKIYFKFKFEV